MAEEMSGPAFVVGMAETVAVMRGLCAAAVEASDRHGHQPTVPSVAISDISHENGFIARWGDDWPTPVQDAHTFGGMMLMAATDFGYSYASLFTGDRAPVYGHLALARAGLEASIVGSWISDPKIETEQRLKRTLCEQLYSAMEVKRLKIDKGIASANVERFKRCAMAMDWAVGEQGRKPVVDGTTRPSVSKSIAEIVVGDGSADLGRVQWSYLSAVIHGTWHGLVQANVDRPSAIGPLGPGLAMVGTSSKSVNAQSVCLLRAIRNVGTGRLTMIGWLDEEWTKAAQRSESHERALVKWIVDN